MALFVGGPFLAPVADLPESAGAKFGQPIIPCGEFPAFVGLSGYGGAFT